MATPLHQLNNTVSAEWFSALRGAVVDTIDLGTQRHIIATKLHTTVSVAVLHPHRHLVNTTQLPTALCSL